MDLNTLDDVAFNNLVTKAGRLRQQRDQLAVQIETAEQQIITLEAQLTAKFGANYMTQFTEELAAIQAYEETLA